MPTLPGLDKLMARFMPVKTNDIILFYRQMALLIESGLNIVTSLELLESQTTNRIFKRALDNIIADIRSGSQMSASMIKHPEIFSPIDCQSLKVGEQTGGLETILRQIADHTEKQVNSRKNIKSAMTYPVIALVLALAVIAVMVIYVFPTFNELYSSLGAQLPATARLMLNAGNFLHSTGIYLLMGGLFAGILIFAYGKSEKGKYQIDRFALKLPLIGRINHLNQLSRTCRSISVLFKAGLPLTEIMPLVIQSSSNKVLAEALIRIREDMLGGEGLSRPMAKYPIFMPMMVQMVRVGEETGNLDNTLLSVAQSYETESEDKTKALIDMIQPIATVVIGLVVAAMAISLVSVMYSMYSQSGV
jgi:type IV pilus assembly protein PilC